MLLTRPLVTFSPSPFALRAVSIMAKKAVSKADAKSQTNPDPPASLAATPKTSLPSGRVGWFDPDTQSPLIDTYARRLESFTRIMADGVVEAREVEEQEARLIALMREIEPLLSDELHDKVTRLLCELTAYDLIQIAHLMQTQRARTQFAAEPFTRSDSNQAAAK
jgi:hypothetical protein